MSTAFPSLTLLRRALWLSAAANFGVAALLLAPQSTPGQLAGLPGVPAPAIYTVLLALFVALFGGAYAILAQQARPDRGVLALAAIGKGLAFVATLALWLAGEASGRWASLLVGDLLFAALFFAWLRQPQNP